jgi:hypothetical protein
VYKHLWEARDFSRVRFHNIVENEYNIPMNDEWGEEVREMCNLSQGIEEKGIRKGLKQGIEQGITQQKQNTISFIKEMQKKGWSAEEILASLTNIEIE